MDPARIEVDADRHPAIASSARLPTTKQRLEGIESLRAYAALSVLLFHVVNAGNAALPSGLGFVATHFGLGVPLFFVVSGFGLAYGYAGKLNDREGLKSYVVRRFMRIAPLFYPALVFQLMLLWLAYGVTFSVPDVVLNAFFLFNLVPPLADGIVPASWTIGVEMIFYGVFPFVILFCTSFRRTALVVALATLLAVHFRADTVNLVALVPSFVYHNFVVQFPFFLCGVCGFHGYRALERRERFATSRLLGWSLIVLAAAGILLLYASTPLHAFLNGHGLSALGELLWGVPFAVLCIGIAVHAPRLLSNRPTRYLGMISFSIYLTHANIVYMLGQIGVYKRISASFPGQEFLAFLVSAALAIAIVAVVATITFRIFEVPGMALGKRLSRSSVAGS